MAHFPTLISDAADALLAVSPGALAAAIALHVVKIGAEARSWHGIVAHTYRDARFRVTLGAFVGAIGANAVLPGRIGEALRVGILRRRVANSSRSTIAATMLVEVVLETAFSVVVVLAVVLAGRSVGSLGAPLDGLARAASSPFALGAAAGAALLAALAWRLCRARLRTIRADLARGFAVLGAPGTLGRSVISWKLAGWALRLAAIYFFLVAFHVPATAWTVLLVVAAQVAASLVPLLPGNAGTQQAAMVVGLAGYATAASVVAFGVGMQAATGLVDVLLGGVAVALLARRSDLRPPLAVRRRARLAGA